MANIGDYVTAKLSEVEDCRQGVFAEENDDGTITVEGEGGDRYVCEADPRVVPDENLFDSTREHVQAVRQRLGV